MRGGQGLKRPLLDFDNSDDEEKKEEPTNEAIPIPSSKKPKAQQLFSDYRIRFPFMEGQYFLSKVFPLEVLPPSMSTPLLQFLCHSSIPEQSVLDKISPSKRRETQKIVFLSPRGLEEFNYSVPNPFPLVINKGHSTIWHKSKAARQ